MSICGQGNLMIFMRIRKAKQEHISVIEKERRIGEVRQFFAKANNEISSLHFGYVPKLIKNSRFLF